MRPRLIKSLCLMLTIAYLFCAAGVIPFHHHDREDAENSAFSFSQVRIGSFATVHSTANPQPDQCQDDCYVVSHFLAATSTDFTLPYLAAIAYGAASAALLLLLICWRLFKPPRPIPIRCAPNFVPM